MSQKIALHLLLALCIIISSTYGATCAYPQVLDVATQACLNTPSDCKSPKMYIPSLNQCDSACPQGSVLSLDTGMGINICIIPLTCSGTDILMLGVQPQCIASADKCTMKLVKDKDSKYVCLPDCPNNFGLATANSNECTTTDVTFSWTGHPFISCTKYRNNAKLTCENAPSDCKTQQLHALYEGLQCVQNCPPNFMISQDQTNTIDFCQMQQGNQGYKMATCSGGQYLSLSSNMCMVNDSDCKEQLIKDSLGARLCWPACPPNFTKSTDASGINLCTPPSSIQISSLKFFTCANGVADIGTIDCLASPANCLSPNLMIPDRNQCTPFCLQGQNSATDPNGKPVCVSNQGGIQCSTTQAQDIVSNQCIDIGQCQNYYLKSDDGKNRCIPDCPSVFTKSTDATNNNVKTCTPPAGKKLSDYTIDSCSGIRDYTSAGCLTNSTDCTGIYIQEIKGCVSACPAGTTQILDASNKVIGCKVPNQGGSQSCTADQVEYNKQCYKPSDCRGFVIQVDVSKFSCIPECPAIFVKSFDSVKQCQTCSPPAGKKLSDYPIGPCQGIRDFPNAGCLTLETECKGFYVAKQNACYSFCPHEFYQMTDLQTGKKSCLEKQKCDIVENFMDNSCIQPQQCQNFLLKANPDDKGICIPFCPSIFTQAFDNLNKINTCNIPPGKLPTDFPIMNCDSPKVRDFTSGKCLDNGSLCPGIFLLDLFACIPSCPIGTEQKTDAAGKPTCALKSLPKVMSCPTGQFLDFANKACISNDVDCKNGSIVLTDPKSVKICFPACPPAWVQSDSSCKVPTDADFSIFLNCNPPSIQSVKDMQCLVGVSQCQDYFIPDKFLCQSNCPTGYQGIVDSKTQQKLCAFQNSSGGLDCPPPLLEYYVKGTCVNPPECDSFLINVGKNLVCIPDCPAGFVRTKDIMTGAQICAPPNNAPLSNYPIANCSSTQIRDFSSAKCLNSASECTQILLTFGKRQSCVAACPGMWTQSTDASGKKTCIEPLKCVYPQILDKANQVCLSDISKCTQGVFNKQTQSCDQSCPSLFQSISDSALGIKICIPCFYKDVKGNCFDKCPPPLIAVAASASDQAGSCSDDISSCKGYFTKALGTCEDKCRFGFSPVDTTIPKTCIPCIQAGNCATVQNSSNCTMMLSADQKICDKFCPPGEVAQPKLATQQYQQCMRCPVAAPFISSDGLQCIINCDAGTSIDKASMKCILPASCSGVNYTDKDERQYCIQRCPYGYIVEVGADKASYCKACAAGKVFNVLTQTCDDTCASNIKDPSGSYCLISISDCQGYISSDSKSCGDKCADGQKIRPLSPTQFQCVDACESSELIYQEKYCVSNCPFGLFNNKDTKTCDKVEACTKNFSLDKKNCYDNCPQGQFPVAQGNSKVCQICKQKVSANGQACAANCGSGEYFDLDLMKCVVVAGCQNKIISADGLSCSTNCRRGQILSTDGSGNKSCLAKIEDCKQKISSDKTQCIAACNAGEIIVTSNNLSFCTICNKGVSDDGKSCKTACLDTELFDVDNKKCVASCDKFTSSNGKKCLSSCVYPELQRPGDTTKCYTSCDTNQLFIGGKCQDQSSCTGYVFGNKCLDDCAKVMQLNDSSVNPKACKKCADDTIPRLIDGAIKCQQKSDNSSNDAKVEAASITDVIKAAATIPPELKVEIKAKISDVSINLEASIKATLNDSSLSQDDKSKQQLNLIKQLLDIGSSFLSKLDTAASSADASNNDDKLVLGSEQFQYVAEKKKVGQAFKVSFSISDFFSSSPSLQSSLDGVDPSIAAKTLDSTLDSLTTTNQANNPYCNDDKCKLVGLFSVSGSKGGSKRILAADGSQGSFSITYNVEASKIDKTVCVTYDETSNAMSPSLSTTADKSKNTVTCTFVSNNSLYLDSNCSIVSSTICNPSNPSNPTTTTTSPSPTNGNYLSVSLTAIISLLALIYLI